MKHNIAVQLEYETRQQHLTMRPACKHQESNGREQKVSLRNLGTHTVKNRSFCRLLGMMNSLDADPFAGLSLDARPFNLIPCQVRGQEQPQWVLATFEGSTAKAQAIPRCLDGHGDGDDGDASAFHVQLLAEGS